jgi:TatD DNase family protein
VAAAEQAGVTRLIAMGTDLERSRRVVDLAGEHPQVWAGVGHYPTEEKSPDIDELRGGRRRGGARLRAWRSVAP